MPYDLYGNYYASRRDAENAEIAQCAAIDADIANRRINELENQLHYAQQPSPQEEGISHLWNHIHNLEARIVALEEQLKSKG